MPQNCSNQLCLVVGSSANSAGRSQRDSCCGTARPDRLSSPTPQAASSRPAVLLLFPTLLPLPTNQLQERLRFALSWLDCHVAAARRMGKPLVLSEWGKQRAKAGEAGTGGSARAGFYAQVGVGQGAEGRP